MKRILRLLVLGLMIHARVQAQKITVLRFYDNFGHKFEMSTIVVIQLKRRHLRCAQLTSEGHAELVPV